MAKWKSILLFICIISGGAFALTVNAKVPTPQIYNIVPSAENSYRPWVVGWTPNEVAVEVLMDDVVVGMAKVVPSESGTASFGWAPQKDLPVGFHQFRVRGVNNNEYSEPGGILGFTIKPPVPAPILVPPEQFDDYILIKGLIKNNMSVKIFIDDSLQADFVVPNHSSGTTNFWFKSRNLLNGLHNVYAVAYYQDGGRIRTSKKGNTISFKTEQQQLTKGDDNETTTEEINQNQDQIVDQAVEGDVKIVQPDNTDVKVIDNEKNVENISGQQNNEGDFEAKGETSSIEEVNNEKNIAEQKTNNTITDSEREKRNRKIGLVILGIMIIILIAWYAVERKKANEENQNDDKDDEVNQEKEEENNSDDQQELDLDGDKDENKDKDKNKE